jgi:hypothetical protein
VVYFSLFMFNGLRVTLDIDLLGLFCQLPIGWLFYRMNTISGRLVYAPFPFTAFHPQAETLSQLADISEQNKGPVS